MVRKPASLQGESEKFWKRHASRCAEQGLLTEATFDSFVLLCRIHGLLVSIDPGNSDDKCAMIKFIALTKQFQLGARGFGLSSDKAKVPIVQEEKDEYGL